MCYHACQGTQLEGDSMLAFSKGGAKAFKGAVDTPEQIWVELYVRKRTETGGDRHITFKYGLIAFLYHLRLNKSLPSSLNFSASAIIAAERHSGPCC